jgi:hypothetical protein
MAVTIDTTATINVNDFPTSAAVILPPGLNATNTARGNN